MKLADELRRISRKSPTVLYYDTLLRDIKSEALEGGNHKVVTLSSESYNIICKRLITDGFDVMIYNYNNENSSHLTYVIWDKERFDKDFKENEDVKNNNIKLHYGLIWYEDYGEFISPFSWYQIKIKGEW